MPFLGEIAALGSAFGYAFTSICYTLAGRTIRPTESLALSMTISWLLMLVVHFVALGTIFPTDVSAERWFNLGMSGTLAFIITSILMLQAYRDIGPQMSLVILSFTPAVSAIFAWMFLGQALPSNAVIGIVIVLAGIVVVVVSRSRPASGNQVVNLKRGLLYTVVATITQGIAFIFATRGVEGDFPPFSAGLVRITVSIIGLWLLLGLQRKIRPTLHTIFTDRALLWQMTGAAVTGPVIASSLTLLSLQLIPLGISTTLSHTTSIMLIPISYVVFREKVTWLGVIGTVVSIAGIAILFS